MTLSAGFLRQKLPKRHAHVVEECRALDVRDVLSHLDGFHRAILRRWNPPTHPWLTLVPHRGGPFRRWWFQCPRCQRRCEALFVAPDVTGEDWRCRVCWSLVYSSQRYGHRHPLRQKLTARKRVTRRKLLQRQERRAASHRRRLEREAARVRRSRGPIQSPAPEPVPAPTAAAGDFAEIRMIAGRPETARRVSRAEVEAEERVRAMLAADAETNARFILAHSRSKGLRARAARFLGEPVPWEPRQRAEPSPEPVTPMLSPEQVARLEAAANLDREETPPASAVGPPPAPTTKPTSTLDELRAQAAALARRLDDTARGDG